MDKSVLKITRKFVIRFIIWFLIFAIISTISVAIIFALSLENIDENDEIEVLSAFKGFMFGMLATDLLVSFLVTKLSIKGALKKVEVTSENKGSIIKNISIVLVIFAIIVCGIHSKIRIAIFENSDSDFDYEEFEEEIREEGGLIATEEEIKEEIEEYDYSEEEEELLLGVWNLWKMTKYYVYDGLFLILMIPVAKKTVEKKVV